MKQDARQDRKDMAVGCAILLVAGAAGIALLSLFATDSSSAPAATPTVADATDTPGPLPSITNNPAAPDDEVEGYWYCWNTGTLGPHHLGHRIPTDHLCTWGELRSSGFAG